MQSVTLLRSAVQSEQVVDPSCPGPASNVVSPPPPDDEVVAPAPEPEPPLPEDAPPPVVPVNLDWELAEHAPATPASRDTPAPTQTQRALRRPIRSMATSPGTACVARGDR